MSLWKTQPAVSNPAPRRAWLWLFALAFDLFALRTAWYWVQELWTELNYAAPTWSGQAIKALTGAGPLFIACWLMAYLARTVGSPFSRSRLQDWRAAAESPRLLWLWALSFGGLALRPAWYWAQALRLQLKYATPSWSLLATRALTEFGPLLVALCLMAFLWRTQGPPFSQPREENSEPSPGGGPEVRGLSQGWKSYESQGEKERRAEQAAHASRFWRSTLWGVLLALLIGASGWALLSVACSFVVPQFGATTQSEMVVRGLAPLAGVLVLVVLLWLVVGPPFVRRR